jgi:hypothetical protein
LCKTLFADNIPASLKGVQKMKGIKPRILITFVITMIFIAAIWLRGEQLVGLLLLIATVAVAIPPVKERVSVRALAYIRLGLSFLTLVLGSFAVANIWGAVWGILLFGTYIYFGFIAK